ADLPYDISIDAELMPQLGHTLLSMDGLNYVLQYEHDESPFESTAWSSGDTSFTSFYGDFNADGFQDLLLQPLQQSLPGVVILGFSPGGQPQIFQVLSEDSLEIDLSSIASL